MKVAISLFFLLLFISAYSQENAAIDTSRHVDLSETEVRDSVEVVMENENAAMDTMQQVDSSETEIPDSVGVYIENMGAAINSYYDDYNAVIVMQADTQLFFTTRRPKGKEGSPDDRAKYKERVLISQFVDEQASTATPSSPGTGKHISVAGVDHHEGALFYYKSKKRFGDVYRVKFKKDGKTAIGKRLPKKINSRLGRETSISFAGNGDAYFISDRRGGKGGKDIWYAQKSGKGYKRPVNLGSAINTPFTEEGVEVSPDGNTLYFSSNGHEGLGGFDVYKVQRTPDGQWGEPVNMGEPINSAGDDLFYHITPDANIALLSSDRSGGLGGLDIYVIKRNEK
jgi:hypothetical protein